MFFRIDKETEISYAIIDRKPSEVPYGQDGATLAHTASATLRHVHGKDINEPYRMTIFSDIFQTIDAVVDQVQHIVSHRPYGKLLIIGAVIKAKRRILPNNVFLSKCAASLLHHLLKTKVWIPQPKWGVGAMPHLLIGFGNGAKEH